MELSEPEIGNEYRLEITLPFLLHLLAGTIGIFLLTLLFMFVPSATPLFSSYSCKSPVLIPLLSISGPHHGLLPLLLHLLCASLPSHSVKTHPRFLTDNVLHFWAFLGCFLCILNISVFSGLQMPITSKMISSGSQIFLFEALW